MDFLLIRFGYLKLTSAMPGLSNPCKLRFKSNITEIFVTDICRIVGDTWIFEGAQLLQIYSLFTFSRHDPKPQDVDGCKK